MSLQLLPSCFLRMRNLTRVVPSYWLTFLLSSLQGCTLAFIGGDVGYALFAIFFTIGTIFGICAYVVGRHVK